MEAPRDNDCDEWWKCHQSADNLDFAGNLNADGVHIRNKTYENLLIGFIFRLENPVLLSVMLM